ncbi:MAG: flagellar biosynthesis protein FlhF, partial [Desulfobacterales bacterium]|nr:flagellar biosynthesis protein FlhF [Desulfobacterales bacterium]
MQIKRFQAQTMTEALRMVKKEFGPDAVILSAQNAKTPPGLLGRLKKNGVEVTAATDNWPAARSEHALSIRLDEEAMPQQLQAAAGGGGRVQPQSTGLSGKIGRIHPFKRFQGGGKKKIAAYNATSSQPAQPSRPLPPTLLNRNNALSGPGDLPLTGLRRQLLRQGVDEEIVSPLLQDLKKRAPRDIGADLEGFKPHMVDILKGMGLKAGRLDVRDAGPEVMVFLGAAGVGKTTTIAKLAAVRALRMKQRVGVITLDNDRIGALHQSRSFAKIIGVPMEVARSGAELKEAIERLKDREVILIDTPGVSPLNEERIQELKGWLNMDRPCQFHLLLSAGAKDRDMAISVERLKGFPLGGLIFTKLDESIGFGNLLNLMVQTGIPATYLTDGPDVTENLEIASLERLTDLLLSTSRRRRPFLVRVRSEERTPKQAAPADPTPRPSSPGPSPESSPGSFPEGNFVANRNSDIFHVPSCKWTRMIKDENIIKFEDVDAALN